MSVEVVHRLGVLLWAVSGTVLLASGWLARQKGREALRRGGRLLDRAPERAPEPVGRGVWGRGSLGGGLSRDSSATGAGGRLRQMVAVSGVVAAGYVVLGGMPGVLAGCAGGWWLYRRGALDSSDATGGSGPRRGRRGRDKGVGEGTAGGVDRAACEAQLPLAADLLAACVAAGADPVAAAEAVGESLGGPVGTRLAQVAAEVRLGGDPVRAWGAFGALPGAAGLARLLERATASGAPAAEPVTRLAADCRGRWARAATARARRAGVLVTAPLGLCFLPAFLAVGVVPVLIGLAGGLLAR